MCHYIVVGPSRGACMVDGGAHGSLIGFVIMGRVLSTHD
jgi:hypothetical protein